MLKAGKGVADQKIAATVSQLPGVAGPDEEGEEYDYQNEFM